ncbi:hypothetical protein ABPG75_012559 [Micractinium tetrahymenae]
MEPAGAASATLSAPSATLAAALGLGVPGPAGPGAAAVPAAAAGPGGDGGLGLDLPLLDDFDDLPGLDDLLLDVAAEDPLFADPFAGGLDSPWGSGPKADVPTKPPKPQQPQPQQAASLQAQLPVPRPFATGSPPAEQPFVMVPQQQVFRLPGISLPLLAAEPAVRSTPPAERWVLLDTSSRRPVKRAALGGVGPSPPQLNVAALKLSAAAPLLAAPDAPSLGSQGALADDAKLLRYIFGWWLPAHRPPAQHAAAAGGAQPNQ